MVESIQWLHINEAVRVYNKTRQTFYNRIKKGYVKTKKVHNKVYISSDDIEYMLSEYLEEVDQTEKNAYIDDLQSSEKEKNNQIPGDDQELVIYELLSEIDGTKQQMTEKIDLIRTKIHQDLQETKRELRSDLDRSYQRIVEEHKLFQDHREDYCQTSFVQTTSHIQTLSLTQKKITFWIGYLVFVFINIVILSVLSL